MSAPVLIAGGYGVVGGQAAAILRARHPGLSLWLGGRTPARGEEVAAGLGGARAIRLDLEDDDDPLRELPDQPAAILAVVNDLDDRLLAAAIERGIPFVDVTRWTSLVHRATVRCAATPPRAPVLLASAWMAGVAPTLAAWAARDLGDIDRIDIAIRYAMADRAGTDSFAYADRFPERYEATIDGRQRITTGLSDPREARFADGSLGRVYRFDTPEQLTLPVTTGARSVATRIGFDSAPTTRALVGLRRAGILRLLARPQLTRARNALLHQAGNGAAAQMRIDVDGSDGRRSVHASDPQGQSHMTAAGAVLALERVLGLDGSPPEPAGARFPEQHPDLDRVVTTLRECGVEVSAVENTDRADLAVG